MPNRLKKGDKTAFDDNWKNRAETYYIHWTKDDPINQIQLAFRNHWLLFQEIMGKNQNMTSCLEVGCGRGSMSAYFSEHGFDCTLLDTSFNVLKTSKEIFAVNKLKGKFAVGDAMDLPYNEGTFDVVFSIGLLEHFENITIPVKEQIRVLSNGGLFLGYVVPKYTDNIQKDFNWINDVLKGAVGDHIQNLRGKETIFRSDANSSRYVEILEQLDVENINTSGVYPLPMISHSIDFPFTLLPLKSENVLVEHFQEILLKRQEKSNKNPWLCQEGYGQAFLIWCFKK